MSTETHHEQRSDLRCWPTEQQMSLDKPNLKLLKQSPPPIRNGDVVMSTHPQT